MELSHRVRPFRPLLSTQIGHFVAEMKGVDDPTRALWVRCADCVGRHLERTGSPGNWRRIDIVELDAQLVAGATQRAGFHAFLRAAAHELRASGYLSARQHDGYVRDLCRVASARRAEHAAPHIAA